MTCVLVVLNSEVPSNAQEPSSSTAQSTASASKPQEPAKKTEPSEISGTCHSMQCPDAGFTEV